MSGRRARQRRHNAIQVGLPIPIASWIIMIVAVASHALNRASAESRLAPEVVPEDVKPVGSDTIPLRDFGDELG